MTAALLAVALLAAPAPAAVKNPDTYVYADLSDYNSLDPDWSFSSAEHGVIANLYEYLLGYRPGGLSDADMEPVLSEAVPTRANGLASADGLTYRFPIRRGISFHDGGEMTAEDVRYSILRFMLLERAAGPYSLLLQPILGLNSTRGPDGKPLPDVYDRAAAAVTVEGSTVVVRLARPFTPFLSIMAGNAAILSRRWCASHGQWDGEAGTWTRFNDPLAPSAIAGDGDAGTGPFRLERWDRRQRQVVLVRHDAYWRGPAKLKRVFIKAVPEFATRKLMLLAGDADAVAAQQALRTQLEGQPGVELIDAKVPVTPTSIFFVVSITTTGNPSAGSGKLDGDGIPADFFAERDVRLAFAQALDFAAYRREVLHGRGIAPAGFMPELLGGHAGAPAHPFDLGASKKLLKRARGGTIWRRGFRMALNVVEGDEATMTVAQMLKRNLESLNPRFRLDVQLVQRSTSVELTRSRKNALLLGSWRADYPDPHNVAFHLMHSEGFYPSQQGWKSAEADALVDKAALAPAGPRRAALYAELQKLADLEVPHVPFALSPHLRAQRTWVKGYVARPDFPWPQLGYLYDVYKSE